MLSSIFVMFASFAVIQGASILRREKSCYQYLIENCESAGDQFCCGIEGQPRAFATCDDDGDNYYIASCNLPAAGCSQSGNNVLCT